MAVEWGKQLTFAKLAGDSALGLASINLSLRTQVLLFLILYATHEITTV